MSGRALSWVVWTLLALVPLGVVVYGIVREAPSAVATPEARASDPAPEPVGTPPPPRPSSALVPPRLPPRAIEPAAAPSSSTRPPAARAETFAEDCMRVPVPSVAVDEILDTFDEARGERRHEAVDIHAPRWTPVVAAAEGEIQKIWESEPGGHTLYVLGEEETLRYYYAHLQAYAEGIEEGEGVEAGEVIAYVGDSGNPVPGNTHLHFAVMLVDSVERWSGGTPVNPLPYLRCELPLPS